MSAAIDGFVSVPALTRALSRRVILTRKAREALGERAATANELSQPGGERCATEQERQRSLRGAVTVTP